MKKCILDTGICIDLANGGLLELVLKLDYMFCIPDLIQSELIEPSGELLERLGYVTISLSPDGVLKLLELIKKYRKPSKKDLSALQCAQSPGSILLTGDKDLRVAADMEGVVTHGILWILDELVDNVILNKMEAIGALKKIIIEGSWLPKRECEKRIRKWRKH